MRKRLLPIIAIVLTVPAAVTMARYADIPAFLFAFAEPPTLMAGCTDVPEAVAMADELRLRSLRIERYLEEIEARKAEVADAEAAVFARLTELKSLKNGMRSRQTQASTAVQDDINRLVAVYDQMKPAEAAAVLANLPADFAAEILMRVQPETGARIIAAVDPRQAATLTTHMGARSAQQR